MAAIEVAMITCWYKNISMANYSYGLKTALERNGNVHMKIVSSNCVCAPRYSGTKLSERLHEDCKFVSFPPLLLLTNRTGITGFFLLLMRNLLQTFRGFLYLIECKNCDIIHYQQSSPFSFGFAPLIPIFLSASRKKLIITIHSVDSLSLLFPFINRLYNHARIIIVHSEKLRREAIQLGVQSSKLKILPHGMSLPDILNLKRKEVTFFGAPTERKGISTIFQALKILEDRGKPVHLSIYGIYSSKEKEYAVSQARHFQIEHCVFFGGALSESDFDRKMQESLFTLAVYSFPIHGSSVVVRAMANETPVIASKTGGIPEYLDEAGLLIEPEDFKSLADTITRLIEDEAYRRKLGDRGREKVKNIYSWDKVASETLQIYKTSLHHEITDPNCYATRNRKNITQFQKLWKLIHREKRCCEVLSAFRMNLDPYAGHFFRVLYTFNKVLHCRTRVQLIPSA